MTRYVMIAVAAASAPLAGAAAQPGAQPGLIGVTRAVHIAEQRLSARALEAELDRRGGRLVYEIELVRGSTLHEALIDARTGRLIQSATPPFEGLWRRWFDAESLGISGAGRLAPTLVALEREKNGRVREAGFDSDDGLAQYEVEFATAAGVADVYIDTRSGKRMVAGYDD